MANICTNDLYLYTEDKENYKYLLEKFESELEIDIHHSDSEDFKDVFDSKWDFPMYIFEPIMAEIPNPDDESLYLRVLSYEPGNYYCAYNVYENKEWKIY